MLTDVVSMGELLNRFFASVFSREQASGEGNVEESEDDQAEVDSGGGEGISVLITKVMVREHLASLGENEAPGTDGMGSSFIKKHGRRYRNTVGLDISEIVGDGKGV